MPHDRGMNDPRPVSPINPAHYRTHPSGIEAINVARRFNFNIGNAIKYVLRHRYKGRPIEDLSKAVWYVEDEGKQWEDFLSRPAVLHVHELSPWSLSNGLNRHELRRNIDAILAHETGLIRQALDLLTSAAWYNATANMRDRLRDFDLIARLLKVEIQRLGEESTTPTDPAPVNAPAVLPRPDDIRANGGA